MKLFENLIFKIFWNFIFDIVWFNIQNCVAAFSGAPWLGCNVQKYVNSRYSNFEDAFDSLTSTPKARTCLCGKTCFSNYLLFCPWWALGLKLDQQAAGSRHNYLQFPVSKGRAEAISDISTFSGSIYWQVNIPRMLHFQKALLLPADIVREKEQF